MITINKQTIHIFPQGENYYSKFSNSAVLSQQFFTDQEIAKISSIFFAAASRTGQQIQITSEDVEIPGDAEEGYKLKYEAAEKERNDYASKLLAEQRKVKALELKIKAQAEYDNPETASENFKALLEQQLLTISSTYERDAVRNVLVEAGELDKLD